MTTNTHIAAQRAAFESAEPGRNHDRKDNGEYADCWTEGEWKEFRDGWQAALQWSAQALEAAELGEGEAPVRGRSAIVSAWNNLPDDIRQSPEMRDLHAAIQDCDDAPPAPALDVQVERKQGAPNVQLDHHSNAAQPEQQRGVAGSLAMGQPVVDGQNAGAGDLGTQGVQPVAEIASIDEYGPCLNWYRHWADFAYGTKLYTSPPPLALVEPLSEEQHAQIYERLHRVGGELNFVSPIAYGKEVERAHGIVTKESA